MTKNRGMLDLARLKLLAEQDEIDTVIVAFSDHLGRLMGKRFDVDFFLVAMPYTLLDQSVLDGPMATCLERGISVIVGAPFASGILATPSDPNVTYNYVPPTAEIREKALRIEAVCKQHGVPLMAAALQFPLKHPAVVSVLPGARTATQLREIVQNSQHKIPSALWADLKRENLILPNAPTS